MSPTIYREGPYRFSFFANEGNEPPHVHVSRDRAEAKFWLSPDVSLATAVGFAPAELRTIERICKERQHEFVEAWNEFFGH
ncbi:MAG TPA: DUF4160 domain-containing protein [Thermoanaerobaculia bacterium]|nr:DUF4160 domain-containing protein [Thermoanaerobaculia bacterium]